MIYEFVFLDTIVHVTEQYPRRSPWLARSTKNHDALLRTCLQIYDESWNIYYRLTTFYVDSSPLSALWYRQLDAYQKSSIREMRCTTWYNRHSNTYWMYGRLSDKYASIAMYWTWYEAQRALKETRTVFEQAGGPIKEGVMKIEIDKWDGMGIERVWSMEPCGEEYSVWKRDNLG